MKKSIAIAERLSAPILWVVGIANLLFLTAFVATLLLLAGPASAQTVACTGTDMLAHMEQAEPAKLAAIRERARLTPNGEGRLWKIEKEGLEPSFLFGTMHMTDPRVVALPPAAQAAFDDSKIVVIETTDLLDPAGLVAIIGKRPELTAFTDGTKLTSLMTPEEAEVVRRGLAERGVSLEAVAGLKPWILSAMVSVPACETARKAGGAQVLDMKLAHDAKAAGKEIGGLETAVSQLETMAGLPMSFHVDGLVETLRLGSRIDDVIETMITIYLDGQTGLFWPFFEAVLPPGDGAGYAEFEERMITARNGGMAGKSEEFIDRGGAFIAIGSLHLPGGQGVVERLRTAGYMVTRAD